MGEKRIFIVIKMSMAYIVYDYVKFFIHLLEEYT